MPIHDWTCVEAGIFHDFHHGWIEEIQRALNAGLLPDDYYALVERPVAGVGRGQITQQGPPAHEESLPSLAPPKGGATGLLPAPPKVRITAETDMEFYRRKQSTVTVRHVSGDRIVAVVEVVSPGNKTGRHALQAFLDKAAELLDKRVHLLILDLHPPGSFDPQGIHGAIWPYITGADFEAPGDKWLTLAAYESAESLRGYIEPVAVGDVLPAMPLFYEPRAYVDVPLEATYASAYLGVPRRWRRVLEGA
ncbi:MAG: DUF4058 family protein [Planctomycetes bacterium]|nr:DUF4058 family protein [Planctomycetota bacterium]